MALSLRCDVCGLLVRNMKEAKDHGEVSGHSGYSESTEAVLSLVCASCGKPCRSQQEQDMHTRRNPGHDTFTDKTAEAAKPLDTGAEIKQIRKEEQELEAAAAAGGAPPPTTAAADTTDAAAAADAASAEPDGELVTPPVDAAALKTLVEMGYGEARALRALYATGADSVEAAVAWLSERSEDAALDVPLLVPANKLKKRLNKDEARAAAEALLAAAKAKREKEEKEAERLREKERIRSGKELLAAKRVEEDQERRRNVDWRAREKAEEAKARERALARVAEDKAARRRKLGLPEQPTEAEVAAEAAKRAAAEAARAPAAARPAAAAAPATGGGGGGGRAAPVADRLRAELVAVKKAAGGDDARAKAAFAALLALVTNAATRDDDKYRRVRLANPAFHAKVGSLDGAVRFLELCGFGREEEGGEAGGEGAALVLPRDKLSHSLLTSAGGALSEALSNPFFGVL